MPIKLIAMDLDGTLMSENHVTVTDKTKRALEKAHRLGIKTVIATGRTLSVTDSVLEQVPFIDYVIYSNGAAVFDRCKGENIYSRHMYPDTVEAVINILESYPVYYEVYAQGKPHSQSEKAEFFENHGLPQEFLEAYMAAIENHESISYYAKNTDIEKINLFYFGGKYYDEIREALCSLDDVAFTSPVAGDLEMTCMGANKGEALKGMCEALKISPDEVMAFGDADNDIEMLKFAKYGVAMANASPVCKAAAAYETLSNSEDGIAYALEKYVFSKQRPKLLVSACLLGENCKYNGGNNYNEGVEKLGEKFEIIPICPECFGGLPIPRVPSEIVGDKVFSKDGKDLTAEFKDGAEKCLYVANECNCDMAVLKERSPSCGFGRIYDGTFTGTLVKGNGFTADLLYNNGIKIYGESEINRLLKEILE